MKVVTNFNSTLQVYQGMLSAILFYVWRNILRFGHIIVFFYHYGCCQNVSVKLAFNKVKIAYARDAARVNADELRPAYENMHEQVSLTYGFKATNRYWLL